MTDRQGQQVGCCISSFRHVLYIIGFHCWTVRINTGALACVTLSPQKDGKDCKIGFTCPMQRATRQKSCMEKIQNRPLGVQFCAKSLDDSATGCETLHASLASAHFIHLRSRPAWSHLRFRLLQSTRSIRFRMQLSALCFRKEKEKKLHIPCDKISND